MVTTAPTTRPHPLPSLTLPCQTRTGRSAKTTTSSWPRCTSEAKNSNAPADVLDALLHEAGQFWQTVQNDVGSTL